MNDEQERRIAQAIADGRLVKAIALVRAATGVSLAEAKVYVAALAGAAASPRKSGGRDSIVDQRKLDSSLAKFTFVLTFVLTIVIVLAGIAGAVALLTNSAIFQA
jgi:hypothetical protein